MDNFPENLRRFFVNLFRSNKFVVNKELVSSIGDVLSTPNDDNESVVVSKLIIAASEKNPIGYSPENISRLIRNLRASDVDEFNKKL